FSCTASFRLPTWWLAAMLRTVSAGAAPEICTFIDFTPLSRLESASAGVVNAARPHTRAAAVEVTVFHVMSWLPTRPERAVQRQPAAALCPSVAADPAKVQFDLRDTSREM